MSNGDTKGRTIGRWGEGERKIGMQEQREPTGSVGRYEEERDRAIPKEVEVSRELEGGKREAV